MAHDLFLRFLIFFFGGVLCMLLSIDVCDSRCKIIGYMLICCCCCCVCVYVCVLFFFVSVLS